jgi:hypothetical protein
MLAQGSVAIPEVGFLLPRAAEATKDIMVDTANPNVDISSFSNVDKSSSSIRHYARNFSTYAEQVMGAAETYLPVAVRDDDVALGFVRIMIKASAKAQISAMKAIVATQAYDGASAQNKKILEQESAIESYSVPDRLTHDQLKKFADKLFDYNLDFYLGSPKAESINGSAFGKYFNEYYKGAFVDRFGQTIKKPELSMTVPNAEIAAALTFLMEYLTDLVDPTPILGDTVQESASTKYYPGAGINPGPGAKKPTARLAQLVRYEYIKDQGCGVTTKNAYLLAVLANAASDRAAALSGLIAETPGGFGVSLGIFGKLSIGDNQTLATIVKAAASKLASRLAYATAYWALSTLAETDDASKYFNLPTSN